MRETSLAQGFVDFITLKYDDETRRSIEEKLLQTRTLLDESLISEHAASQPVLLSLMLILFLFAISAIISAITLTAHPTSAQSFTLHLTIFLVAWVVLAASSLFFVYSGVTYWHQLNSGLKLETNTSQYVDSLEHYGKFTRRKRESSVLAALFNDPDYNGDFEEMPAQDKPIIFQKTTLPPKVADPVPIGRDPEAEQNSNQEPFKVAATVPTSEPTTPTTTTTTKAPARPIVNSVSTEELRLPYVLHDAKDPAKLHIRPIQYENPKRQITIPLRPKAELDYMQYDAPGDAVAKLDETTTRRTTTVRPTTAKTSARPSAYLISRTSTVPRRTTTQPEEDYEYEEETTTQNTLPPKRPTVLNYPVEFHRRKSAEKTGTTTTTIAPEDEYEGEEEEDDTTTRKPVNSELWRQQRPLETIAEGQRAPELLTAARGRTTHLPESDVHPGTERLHGAVPDEEHDYGGANNPKAEHVLPHPDDEGSNDQQNISIQNHTNYGLHNPVDDSKEYNLNDNDDNDYNNDHHYYFHDYNYDSENYTANDNDRTNDSEHISDHNDLVHAIYNHDHDVDKHNDYSGFFYYRSAAEAFSARNRYILTTRAPRVQYVTESLPTRTTSRTPLRVGYWENQGRVPARKNENEEAVAEQPADVEETEEEAEEEEEVVTTQKPTTTSTSSTTATSTTSRRSRWEEEKDPAEEKPIAPFQAFSGLETVKGIRISPKWQETTSSTTAATTPSTSRTTTTTATITTTTAAPVDDQSEEEEVEDDEITSRPVVHGAKTFTGNALESGEAEVEKIASEVVRNRQNEVGELEISTVSTTTEKTTTSTTTDSPSTPASHPSAQDTARRLLSATVERTERPVNMTQIQITDGQPAKFYALHSTASNWLHRVSFTPIAFFILVTVLPTMLVVLAGTVGYANSYHPMDRSTASDRIGVAAVFLGHALLYVSGPLFIYAAVVLGYAHLHSAVCPLAQDKINHVPAQNALPTLLGQFEALADACEASIAPVEGLWSSAFFLALSSIIVSITLFRLSKYFLRMKTEHYMQHNDIYGTVRRAVAENIYGEAIYGGIYGPVDPIYGPSRPKTRPPPPPQQNIYGMVGVENMYGTIPAHENIYGVLPPHPPPKYGPYQDYGDIYGARRLGPNHHNNNIYGEVQHDESEYTYF
ncbi:unnamed protein product, partial [Mesorhabditis spiculigera]